jgi:hypothetical protein
MKKTIILVSGLPRSGTSMVMNMLKAGGIEIVVDHVRQADEDNPKGYYEYEKVKHLQKDASWMPTMSGKAIKVISFLLYHLPLTLHYQILFIQRPMEEILTSQKKMLDRLECSPDIISDEVLAQKFERHLQKIRIWLKTQKNMECLYLDYHALLEEPLRGAKEIQEFLQQPLDLEKMAAVVDPALYRNRSKE